MGNRAKEAEARGSTQKRHGRRIREKGEAEGKDVLNGSEKEVLEY